MNEAVAATILPAAVTAVPLALAWRPWSRSRPQAGARGPGAAAMLGFAGAFVAAFRPINGVWPSLPPLKGEDWLPWLVIAAAAVSALDLWRRPRTETRVGVAVVFFGALASLILMHPLGAAAWGARVATVVTLAVLSCALWRSIEVLAGERPGPSGPLVLGTIFAGAAALLLQSGNARLALNMAAGGIGFAPGAILAIWRRDVVLGRPVAFVVGTVFSGVLIAAHYFSERFTLPVALVVAGTLPAAAIVGIILADARRPWLRVVVQLVVVVALLVAAGALIPRSAPDPYASARIQDNLLRRMPPLP